jgi:hypothetical protein
MRYDTCKFPYEFNHYCQVYFSEENGALFLMLFYEILQVIPSTKDLVKTIRCACSVAEVLRMEAIILNKLSWNIKQVTAVDLLHIVSQTLQKLSSGLSNSWRHDCLQIFFVDGIKLTLTTVEF